MGLYCLPSTIRVIKSSRRGGRNIGETENAYNVFVENLNQKDILVNQHIYLKVVNTKIKLKLACVVWGCRLGFILFLL